MLKKIVALAAFMISLMLSIVFSVMGWKRNQLPYNEEGRFFDGTTVLHEQSLFFYGLAAISSIIACVFLARICFKVFFQST